MTCIDMKKEIKQSHMWEGYARKDCLQMIVLQE